MSKPKKQSRRQKQQQKRQKSFESKRRELRRWAERLGVTNFVRSATFKSAAELRWYPTPSIQADNDTAEDGKVAQILKELEPVLRTATFDCPSLGPDTNVVEFFTFGLPILEALRACGAFTTADRSTKEIGKRLANVAAEQTVADAGMSLQWALTNVLLPYGQMDEKLYFVKPSQKRGLHGDFQLKFLLQSVVPEIVSFKDDDDRVPRKAFRCGRPFVNTGIDWVTWEAEQLGLENLSGALPVYVRKHVLDRLHERLNFIRTPTWILNDFLWRSLREPRLLNVDNASMGFLVPYHLVDYRVGYLSCRIVERMVVVYTFLFLTMDGTPEGRNLRERLRVQRPDKEHLELDKLETFLFSDIKKDPGLLKLFRECGCGHLFEIVDKDFVSKRMTGYARDIRKYLSLGPREDPAKQ